MSSRRALHALHACAHHGAIPSSQVSGNELSTSTLTAPTTLVLSGFGPVHPQGYGVSYQLPQESLRFCTSAYKPRSARRFNEELGRALGTVQALLDASGTGAGVQARL